jgi:hypothetical protein
MAKKVIKNLVIDQGATYSETIAVTTDGATIMNLTGYVVTSQFRKSYDSTTYTSFTTADVDATGVSTLSLTSTQTAALKYGRYVYDVEIASSSNTYRVQEGIVTVSPQVTK